MLKGTFPIEFDGQEAQMIIDALMDKVSITQHPSHHPLKAAMYYILAQKIKIAKKDFHEMTLNQMAPRYDLDPKIGGNE